MARVTIERGPSGALSDHEGVMRHHRRAWIVERIGWACMAFLLGAALLGLFGDGPLSRTSAGDPGSVLVHYDRLVRSSAPTEYRFQIRPGQVRRGVLQLRLDAALVEHMELDSIVPEPEAATTGPGYVQYLFRADPGQAPLQIDLRYRAATFGRHAGRVWVNGRMLRIDQFAFP